METDIDSYLASDDALRETASAQGDLLHPGETFGGFSIVSFLGRGATSEVWRVKDEALNAKGVVHRDIKPANVLLDDYGNAILTDFGIVQIDDGDNRRASRQTGHVNRDRDRRRHCANSRNA